MALFLLADIPLTSQEREKYMATFTLALINNHEAGKLFFETYNIPYQVITKGENKGKLRVKATRSSDGQAVLDARKELEYAGYGFLAAIVTFSVMRMIGLW